MPTAKHGQTLNASVKCEKPKKQKQTHKQAKKKTFYVQEFTVKMHG